MNRHRQIYAAGAAVLVIAVAALGFALFRSPGGPIVDFNDTASGEAGPADDERPVLRVAVAAMISPSVTQHYYEDILALIGNKLEMRAFFVQRRTYAEVNDLLERREIDVAFVCSGPYVQGHDKFGMEIIAVPVVNGGKVYYSYIIANKTSSIRVFDDFKGRRFAFADPDSNTGCLVPRFMLAQRGQTPETFFRDVFFTHSHDNSIRAVARGMADGAAVDSLIWEFMNATAPADTAGTKIVAKSPPYGIPPVVVHPAMAPALKQRLTDVLLALHKDPAAVRLLQHLRIERFEAGHDEMYATVRDMQVWLAKNRNP